MNLDRSANTTGLRAYATAEELGEAVKRLVQNALFENLMPHDISIRWSEDYETSGEYYVILWASW